MPIDVRKGSVTTTTYTVKGNSLSELWDDILHKGPQDLNDRRRYSGVCECTGDLVVGRTGWDSQTEQTGKRQYETQLWIKNGRIEYTCAITMPKLAQSSLGREAQREWERFLSAVETHENGHVTSYGKEMKKIARELEEFKATGKGRNEIASKRAAQKSYKREAKSIANFRQRTLDDAARYDRQTQHGKSQGAVLKTSIQ